VAVVWNFETLPRWALAVLAVREVVQIVYGNYALRHGVDLYVNWPGRIAVWPSCRRSSRLVGWTETFAEVLLYIGLFFAIWATALYIREGSASR
jgi:cardiolipin synthase